MSKSREALTKALFWRIVIAIPIGTLITYAWVGEVWKSITLMLFMNALFTWIHYVYEIMWPTIWEKINDNT